MLFVIYLLPRGDTDPSTDGQTDEQMEGLNIAHNNNVKLKRLS